MEWLFSTVQNKQPRYCHGFGLNKSATLTINGKNSKNKGIKMSYGNTIKSLVEEDHYKYLGIFQTFNTKYSQDQEYIRKVKKILKSKHSGRNSTKALNTWGIHLERC